VPTIPIVIEKTGHVEQQYDLFSRLLKDRIVFIGSAIDDHVANIVVGQLLFLYMESKDTDIQLYINSPGGLVTSSLAIYDTMQYIQCDISTTCIGQASSMGAVLLAAGAKGKRYALPNARIMLHQPWGGAQGTASDILLQADEITRLKDSLAKILQKHTGQPLPRILEDTDRDFYMSPQEAKEYGIVDEVYETIKTDGK